MHRFRETGDYKKSCSLAKYPQFVIANRTRTPTSEEGDRGDG
jgi:hypothetical protein